MKSHLEGPYDLSFDCLEYTIPRQSVGVYAIGHVDAAGVFRVQRVGRDEVDVKERLRCLIGSGNKFKYALAPNAYTAFDMECELFHRLKPPSNITHPDRPRASGWKCRHCLQFHR